MKIKTLFALSLIGLVLFSSCDKDENKELGIEGKWRLVSVECLFRSEVVATASSMSGFSSLYFSDKNVTVNNNSTYSYSFENGTLLINDEEWKVNVLNESDLVLEVPSQRDEPDVLIYIEQTLQGQLANGMIDKEEYDKVIEKISISYLGERVFMADTSDDSGIYYYYYDSNGKRVPCDLVGGEAFATSYRMAFKRR